MADQILEWLERAHHPGDIYELLGKRRFDPNVAALQTAVSEATREILPYQGHSDSAKAQRAMRLLTDLGGADTVLADAEKVKKHDVQILDYLFDEYASEHGQDTQKWDQTQLRNWLTKSWDVHPDSLDKVLEQLCPAAADGPKKGQAPQARKGRRSVQTGRKKNSGGKRRRRNVDQMFDGIGVESGAPRTSGRGRSARGGRSQSARRRSTSQTPLLAYAVFGAGFLALIIAAVMFWPRGDRSGECVLIVDPVDAKVKVERKDVVVRADGDRRAVVISDAEAVAENEPVVISIESQGYHPREIRWTPQTGQSSEIKVQLYRDFGEK
ncbi:MAG: hypothetical protein ABGZ17_09020 [Planctomycetaceae bacterium]